MGQGLNWLAVQQAALLGGAAHLVGFGLAATQQGSTARGSCPPAMDVAWEEGTACPGGLAH